jgi:hypothetical protein
MPRLRFVAPLAAILAIAIASVAFAAKVTGGTTTLKLSSATQTALSNNHITVTESGNGYVDPLAGQFTFPISGGNVNLKTFKGFITHKGSVVISNGTKSFSLSHLTIVNNRNGISVDAAVRTHVRKCFTRGGRHHRIRVCLTVYRTHVERVAKVVKAKVSGGSATGTVELTATSAAAINGLAGKHIASAGTPIGTGTTTPTFKK